MKVGFLGVVIGLEGIKIKKENIKAVSNWLTPKRVKKFLELTNYYRWFVKDFASITRSLHNLVKKE